MDEFLFPASDVAALRAALDGLDPDAVIGLEPPMVRFSPLEERPDAATDQAPPTATSGGRCSRSTRSPTYAHAIELFLSQAGISRDVRTPYFGQSDALPGADGVDDVVNSFPGLLDRADYLPDLDGRAGRHGVVLHAPVLLHDDRDRVDLGDRPPDR